MGDGDVKVDLSMGLFFDHEIGPGRVSETIDRWLARLEAAGFTGSGRTDPTRLEEPATLILVLVLSGTTDRQRLPEVLRRVFFAVAPDAGWSLRGSTVRMSWDQVPIPRADELQVGEYWIYNRRSLPPGAQTPFWACVDLEDLR